MNSDGTGHAVKTLVSSAHSKVAFGSSLPKANVAVGRSLGLSGPNSIVVSGGPTARPPSTGRS